MSAPAGRFDRAFRVFVQALFLILASAVVAAVVGGVAYLWKLVAAL